MKNLIITLSILSAIGALVYYSKSSNDKFPQLTPVSVQDTMPQQNTDASEVEDTVKFFSEGAVEFKMLIQEEPRRQLNIYRKEGSNWTKIQELDYDIFYKHQYEQLSIRDWNKDGFVDILTHWRTGSFINLYNPNKKEFIESGSFNEMEDLEDGYKFDYTYIRPVWVSTLFKIENYEKMVYATLALTMGSKTEPREILVYKGEQKLANVIDTIDKSTIPNFKELGFSEFDYKAYWKKNWRKFVK